MFAGVEVDTQNKLIIWTPSKLKENIFDVLAMLSRMFEVRMLGPFSYGKNESGNCQFCCVFYKKHRKLNVTEVYNYEKPDRVILVCNTLSSIKDCNAIDGYHIEKSSGAIAVIRESSDEPCKLVMHASENECIVDDAVEFNNFLKEVYKVTMK